jgi:hypothetical protein
VGQEHLEKELEDERERNKDDITHLELLGGHYKERERLTRYGHMLLFPLPC